MMCHLNFETKQSILQLCLKLQIAYIIMIVIIIKLKEFKAEGFLILFKDLNECRFRREDNRRFDWNYFKSLGYYL